MDASRFSTSPPCATQPDPDSRPARSRGTPAVLRAGSATAYVEAAQRCTEEAASLLARTFDASGSDVLLSLSNRHANVYATAGFPAVTVSAGLRSGSMPVGATLVAPIGEDARLLEIAHALEQATGPRPVPPLPA